MQSKIKTIYCNIFALFSWLIFFIGRHSYTKKFNSFSLQLHSYPSLARHHTISCFAHKYFFYFSSSHNNNSIWVFFCCDQMESENHYKYCNLIRTHAINALSFDFHLHSTSCNAPIFFSFNVTFNLLVDTCNGLTLFTDKLKKNFQTCSQAQKKER